jgi:tRNA dimethylallyltransferase
MKEKLVVIAGPTAVGKTSISIAAAKRLNAEIISADSMQVYKYMDIGSAKIRPEEMQGVRHFLVDCIEPTENYDVARFKEMAGEAMSEIRKNGHIPLIVGGTGFYIQAVTKNIEFSDNSGASKIRDEIYERAKNEGNEEVYKELLKLDPEAAEKIHPNNLQRMARAIEYITLTGEKFSEMNKREGLKESPYNLSYFVLTKNREQLYKDIEYRVDLMLEDGLIAEVMRLVRLGVKKDMTSMQGLGYREMYDFAAKLLSMGIKEDEASFENVKKLAVKEVSLMDELNGIIYAIKENTRHYAKRQMTWFRREAARGECIFIDKDKFSSNDEILEFMAAKVGI